MAEYDSGITQTVGGEDSGHIDSPGLQQLDPAEQRETLTRLVGTGKSDEEIGQEFGLSQWQVRNLRYKLGIKKDRGGNVYLREPEIDLEAHGAKVQGARRLLPSIDGEAASPPQSGLHISWGGSYRAEELASRLDGLQGLMRTDLDNHLYSVRVEIRER